MQKLLIAQNSHKQTIFDFQINANKPYPIVDLARIVGNFGQIVLVASYEIYAITAFIQKHLWNDMRITPALIQPIHDKKNIHVGFSAKTVLKSNGKFTWSLARIHENM